MPKRLELYADAALLAFPFALVTLLGLAIVRLDTGSWGLPLVAVFGAGLATWASRVLHHMAAAAPITRRVTIRTTEVVALAVGLLVLLWFIASTVGPESAGLTASAIILFAGLALFIDGLADLLTQRLHVAMDIVRIVLVTAFGAAVLGSPWGEALEARSGLLWVGLVAYLIAVAVFAWLADLAASWVHRSRDAHGHLVANH